MYFSGQHGLLQVSDNASSDNYTTLCAVRNWSYTVQQQVLETTSLESTDRTLIDGVRSISGTASLFFYEDGNSGNNIERIGGKLIKTSKITEASDNYDSCSFGNNDSSELCKLKLDLKGGSSSNPKTIGLYAYITSFAMTCAVGEVVSADISFEGHGAPFEWNY